MVFLKIRECVIVYFCASVCLIKAQEIIFQATQGVRPNDPCTLQTDGSPGICLPPPKCNKFDELMTQHKSFVDIACWPISSGLVCCPQITRINTVKEIVDASEPANAPEGCGSIADLTYANLPEFYRGNQTAESLQKDGYAITNHIVYGDRLVGFEYRKGSGVHVYTTREEAIGGADSRFVLARYMAIIGEKTASGNDWFCDGVLINWEWVLTAAHCFKKNPSIVRLGEYNLGDDTASITEDPQDYGVKRTVLFPGYKFPSSNHDLALIQLDRLTYISRRDINPICLPWGERAVKSHIGQQVTLTGWGATQFGRPMTDILQEVNITVFDPEVCTRGYSTLRDFSVKFPTGIRPETHICAGDELGGKDACQGDSGGPIVYHDNGKYYLAGIVSAGHGCGLKEFPGTYVPINTPKYLSWIKKVAF